MQSPSTGPTVASDRTTGFFPTIGGKYFALAALFSMNLLNYIDRYTFFAVGKQIMDDLKIDEPRYGVLSVSFMVVYTFISPVMGWMGDRYSRRGLLAFGVGLWSLATIGTAFSVGFTDMFFWRALLGVGEATYGVIAPALLADLFPPKHRGRVMGLYFLALPLGGGLGYLIGGGVAHSWNWRAAFFVVGLPGLLAALGGLLMNDPGRGASEDSAHAGPVARPGISDYKDLFRTPTFLFNTAGMAAVTFATGAYAAWGSIFYQTVRGMSLKDANTWIGGMTLVAGLLGIGLGAWIADGIRRFTRRAYLLLAFAAVAAAIVPGLFALITPERNASLSLLFVAMILMAMVLGPCNAVTANVVPANRRAAGYAVSIFLIHIFGDISSPVFIGVVSKAFGSPTVAGSPIGQFFASIGAWPVAGTNLTVGMLSVVPVLGLGAFFFLLGSRHLPADQERAVHASGGASEGAIFGH
jgi:MFS transporter, Spinster family, sphingosine-1-phosphate transporter